MAKAIFAFILTVVAGILGLIVGLATGMDGYLGVFFSIATMGAFIVYSLEKNKQ